MLVQIFPNGNRLDWEWCSGYADGLQQFVTYLLTVVGVASMEVEQLGDDKFRITYETQEGDEVIVTMQAVKQ